MMSSYDQHLKENLQIAHVERKMNVTFAFVAKHPGSLNVTRTKSKNIGLKRGMIAADCSQWEYFLVGYSLSVI